MGGGGGVTYNRTMKRFKTSNIAVLIKLLFEFTQNVIKKIEFVSIQARGWQGGVTNGRVFFFFLLQVGAPISVGVISEGVNNKQKVTVFLLPFPLVESSMAIQIVTKLSFVWGENAQS